jgi:hypothetical protein
MHKSITSEVIFTIEPRFESKPDGRRKGGAKTWRNGSRIVGRVVATDSSFGVWIGTDEDAPAVLERIINKATGV